MCPVIFCNQFQHRFAIICKEHFFFMTAYCALTDSKPLSNYRIGFSFKKQKKNLFTTGS